jgi:O-antigen/teichoic acid export membrane protein
MTWLPRRPPLGKLAQNTLLGAAWQFVRVGMQMATAIVVARLLGPGNFGLLAGITGLATALGGLAGLGTGYLMLQGVSRDHGSFGQHWRKATVTTLVSGIALAMAFVTIATFLFDAHVSISVLLAIAVSELVAYPLVLVAAFAFQAHERLGWTSALPAMLAGSRFVAAGLVWWLVAGPDLGTYVRFYSIASVCLAVVALAWTAHTLRPGRAVFSLNRRDAVDGLGFSSLWFTNSGLTELDKTLALKFLGAELAGFYSAAYRMASALVMPVGALVLAAQPRLFRHGAVEGAGQADLVQKLALAAFANSVVAGLVLYFAAGVLPWLLGPEFEGAVAAARLLALWPLAYSARLLAGTLLVTRGHRGWRAAAECLSIVALAVASSVLMPRYGLSGAAVAIVGIEGLLAAIMWLIVFKSGSTRAR